MSGSKRRQRKERARAKEATDGGEPLQKRRQGPWDWRTFPVFFAFSGGGFLSLLLGLSVGSPGLTIVFAVFGGMFGFGISRWATRALVNRGVINQR